MYVSDSIIVDIVDKSAQSITSRPITETLFNVAEGQTRWSEFPIIAHTIKISVVTVSGILHQIPINFTDELYGATLPTTAEFAKGEYFTTMVDVLNYNAVGNYMNTEVLVNTGAYWEDDPAEPDTHVIKGTISDDGIVSVLEKDSHILIKTKAVTAGHYSVPIPLRAEVDVIAKKTVSGEMLGHGNVVPIIE